MENNDDPFWARVGRIYDGIFDQMPNDFHYQMIHLGYSKFFNVDEKSTWCNDQTFGKLGLSGFHPPKLTFELRNKLNDLTDDWNRHLYVHLLEYLNRRMNEGPEPDRWHWTRMFYGNYDNKDRHSFNGHRFCEPGVEDPQFGDPSTWFFGVWGDQNDAGVSADHFRTLDAASCASDPKYDVDDAFAWDCDMTVYYADPNTDHGVITVTGDQFVRSFHPKTSGFESVKTYLAIQIKKIRRHPPVAECIPAPGPDLDDPASLPPGFPASLCATAPGAYATSLIGSEPPKVAPPLRKGPPQPEPPLRKGPPQPEPPLRKGPPQPEPPLRKGPPGPARPRT